MLRLLRLPCSLLAVLGLTWLLAGCSPRYQPPLTLGTNTWIGYEPLYLARELGYYDGANLRLVELASTTQTLDALRIGTLDMAAVTLDEALLLAQEGQPISVLWVLNISAGADALIAKPAITALAQLRGKRIGVEQTATGAYMLDAALQQAGLQVQDITIVPLPLDEHFSAWQANAIDAVVTFDPARQKLLHTGGLELFTSQDIPGQIVNVLVARQSALDCCRPQIAQVIAGQQRALQYLRQTPKQAWQHMAPRQGVAAENVADALSGIELPDARMNRQLLTDPTTGLPATTRQLVQTMQQNHLLHSPPDTAALIRADFAVEAAP
ncbi:MAG: ABC transporter substrate-binding protein [Comamonas sp.]|nr:ABC transporter substrate-binding protein [Comamonas sp.]